MNGNDEDLSIAHARRFAACGAMRNLRPTESCRPGRYVEALPNSDLGLLFADSWIGK